MDDMMKRIPCAAWWRRSAAVLAVLAFAGWPAATVQADGQPLYRDARADVDARVSDLLGRMTLEEKVAQMLSVWQGKVALLDEHSQFDATKAAALYPHGFGSFARPSDRRGAVSPRIAPGRDTRGTVAMTNAIQHFALEHTRLGIPVLFHEEGLHGYMADGATNFPQAIGLASSWDPDLVQRVNAVVAREIRARGVHLVLSPVVDVARDPRWGRIEETFGEDPYLVSQLGIAAVRGLQGDSLPLADGKVYATLKHFTGHGQPENGTNVGPAGISLRTLRENFFPPFEQIVKHTEIRALMPSYNEIDGVPSHANRWLLQDVLRGEWGFKGAIVSDYEGIEQLVTLHHVEPDLPAAAIRALRAGVDIDLPDGAAYATLVQAVRDGKVPEQQVDAAVRRILKLKFEAGLFEHPYADADAAVALTGNAQARALALEAAHRAVVLLKNDGLLPLSIDAHKKLAVIGPNAAAVRLGGYSASPLHVVTALEGIRAKLAGREPVAYAQGVEITRNDDWWADEVALADPRDNERRIAEAVQVAAAADEIVLVVGDTEQTSREGWADTHLGDRDDLELAGQQGELADALFALHKPIVVVLLNGRPLSVGHVAERANALVEGWYLGQEGGTALADILFGDVNPGGKLPVSIARSVGQLPIFYNRKPSARRGYLFDTVEPLFPFGFGLSYTSFEIGAPELSSATIKPDGSTSVAVEVKNTGARAGDEVVQLYIRDEVSSVTRPVLELKGFQRITLAPGESRRVRFEITPAALQFWNADMQRVVEPGRFTVLVGADSAHLKKTLLTVEP
ncbi:MAG TPA: glycoside hydrolase family 3 N-terminal domain-containing protein [Burkholderiaceae bacterium]|nr:glycoside hydrolase family 3 N-terminal domain-containing protein [Burkholderiaceae bacterium]